MNAYLFSAVITLCRSDKATPHQPAGKTIQRWDTCMSQIVLADSSDEAQRLFDQLLNTPPPEDDSVVLDTRKTAVAQFVDRLLTESGNEALDWTELMKQAQAQIESTALDDFEQGYWVDAEQFVPSDERNLSIGALKEKLPEEIRSGLNWSNDKNFLFVLSVLSPLASEPEPADESEEHAAENLPEDSETSSREPRPISLGELYRDFPQALDKEAAALIRARNSVIAAWLWRRYATDTPLATHQIRIDPWCGVFGQGV